ncbi:MAG: helix-turn-helix transcriptional regulator [Acidimicrobiales bacterium]
MTRHRGTGAPADGENPDRPPPPPSPADIGRVLREKREALGLDLLTVHDRLGRPITQLEALENGDLSRLHNQAFALSTLRRYARFLTLDGDALALQFMQSVSVGRPGRPSPPPAGRRGAASTPTGMVAAVDSGPEHLRAFTQTGPVPRVGGYDNGLTGTGFGSVGPPTGTLSVIPREQIKETRKAQRRARRSRQAPALLRLATWVVLAALLVALVGVGLRYGRPQLLVQWHIAQPNGALYLASPPPSTAPTTPHHPRDAAVKQVSTDNQTEATYTVSNSNFKVILTTTAPCYVQINSPASVNAIVADVQPPNVTKSYPASGSLTVQIGAAGVSISVSVKGSNVFTTVPKIAPFTYTFNSTPGP